MELLSNILKILEIPMETPASYGWFHLLWWAIVIGTTVLLCTRFRHCSADTIWKVVFGVAVVVAVLEIYKQVVYTFAVGENGITADYQWYAFPWQFCSSPMYVGLLVGIFRKGKVHDALCAYLATFAVFAGTCVMVYPNDVFVETIGINIQTMICHGSMIVVGVWLLATQHVKLESKSILKAMAVFATTIGVAIILNEVTWYTGITGDETFNMFFISRHWPGSLPVYSLVQQVVPYPWCLLIYISVFSIAAYIILLVPMAIVHAKKRERTSVAQ